MTEETTPPNRHYQGTAPDPRLVDLSPLIEELVDAIAESLVT